MHRFPGLRILTILILALAFMDGNAVSAHGVGETAETMELRVMSFNIEWGGEHVSFENVAEAIRRSGADMVGIQEAEGNLQRLAIDLGWYHDQRNYVISKFPLLDPPGADGKYVFAEVRPGEIAVLANVHLPSDPYGPDAVRDGAPLDKVMQIELATRVPKIEPWLEVLSPLHEQGIPVFLTGDFNAPAHTDWTEETIGLRPFLKFAVDWPVSKQVSAAGFKDSWRTVFPDPVKNPGLTWWAGRPPLPDYAPGANDAQDRIDFVWSAGQSTIVSSEIVGERGGPEVSFGIEPWPSDHRAIVSEFRIVPSPMPALVSTNRRVYPRGEDVRITCNPGSQSPLSVSVVNQDGSPVFVQSCPELSRWRINAERFSPGHYQATIANPGGTISATRDFWVQARDAKPVISVIGGGFKAGEHITLEWRDAPGHRNDYVAIFLEGAPVTLENILAWTYIDAMPDGRLSLNEHMDTGWPLPTGRYVARLMKDDGIQAIAASRVFTVE